MKKVFFAVLLVAVAASFFASSHPDGLEKVAENLGFIESAQERSAPLPDYSTPGVPEGGLSTATAGIAGVMITLAVFWLAVYIMKKGNNGMNKMSVFLVALIMLTSSAAFAARPLVTDDYGTLDPGAYEFEAGYNFISPKAGGGDSQGLVCQLKRGFFPGFDLGLELPYNTSAVSGLADAVLHAKLRIKDLSEEEGVSARLDVKLTNGDAATGLGSGFTDYALLLILSKDLAGIRSHFNAGYTVIGDAANSSHDDTFVYGAAFEKEICSGIETAIEYTGSCCLQRGLLNNVQVAGRWQATRSLRLDAGYSIAMSDVSSSIATAGLTLEF
ncbi:MAG: PDGLE domain-containing protein [Candidatus Margulisiibacteriota bacterium]